jgi:hypothetical protein
MVKTRRIAPCAATALAAAPLPLLGCDLWLQPPVYADLLPPTMPDAAGVARFALPIPGAVRGTLALQALTLVPGRLVLGEACEVRVD